MKKHLVVFSGAGLSAESGLPTYRDDHGLWKNQELCELMSAGGYYENPQSVLDVLNEMRWLCYLAQPNHAHIRIAELEQFFDVSVVTQNVDDLHERAGSTKVLHLHGKLSEVTSSDNRCNQDCIKEYPMNKLIKIGDKADDGSQLRPNVVLFGEYLTEYSRALEIIKNTDIFLIIGTSLQVFPASQLVKHISIEAVKYCINPDVNVGLSVMDCKTIVETACKGMDMFTDEIIRKYVL